jgi:hypothetical protein
MIPFVGRLAPAGPIELFETVLPVLAPPVEVLNRMVPVATPTAPVDEPSTVQFVTVSLVAPLMKRIVLVPAVAEAVVFEIVSELPLAFKPLMLTLSAPARSISGLPATVAPVTVRAPDGLIVSVVQEPPVGWFKTADRVVSSVSPTMLTVMLFPVWVVFVLIASKAAFNVA